MKTHKLVSQWQSAAAQPGTYRTYDVSLPVDDAARVETRPDLLAHLMREPIIPGLLPRTLDELGASLGHEPGNKASAYGLMGDPMSADVGLIHRFSGPDQAHEPRLAGDE